MFRLPGFVAVKRHRRGFRLNSERGTGIILSIGVGVDANIITASRIKEELYSGKTLDDCDPPELEQPCRGRTSPGRGHADRRVRPVNITIFGASKARPFGYTLLVGVIGRGVLYRP